MEKVGRYYDREYDEWSRLERHKIEFDITKRYLDEYVTGTNLKVFDIGGGPGRYAFYLAQKGHRVSLLDLSRRNIEVAKEQAAKKGIRLEAYIHGNALELGDYGSDYDLVLLMGPLYHLVKAQDRRKALGGSLRLLKPGGLLVASFISSYAPICDNLKSLYPMESPGGLLYFLEHGENIPESGFTTAYFSGPQEARDLMGEFGLQELVFAAVENILSSKEQEINALDETEYRKWLEVCYELSQDPNLFGTGEHFLYIGRKE